MKNWEQSPRTLDPQNLCDDPYITLGAMTAFPSLPQFLTLCGLLLLDAEPWFHVLLLAAGGALVFWTCLPLLWRRREPPASRVAVAEISGPNGIAGTVVLCAPRDVVRKSGTFITVYIRGITALDREFDFGLCIAARGAAFKTPLEASYAPTRSANDAWLVMLRGFNPYMTLGDIVDHPSAKAGINWARRGKRYHVTGALKICD